MVFGFFETMRDFRVAESRLDVFDGLELDNASFFAVVTLSLQCYEDTHSQADHVPGDFDWYAAHQVGYSCAGELVSMNLENPAFHDAPPKLLNSALNCTFKRHVGVPEIDLGSTLTGVS